MGCSHLDRYSRESRSWEGREERERVGNKFVAIEAIF